MTAHSPKSDAHDADRDTRPHLATAEAAEALRDIADVPAVEVVTTVALHLMSAAAVKVGLGSAAAAASDLTADPVDGPTNGSANGSADEIDLDEARTLISALAGLITASAPRLGTFHAAPLRDGLKTLQLAFREASPIPDAPGAGPGEDLTGPVYG